MAEILIIIHAFVTASVAFISLAFVISSVRERHKRPALVGGVLLCGLLVAGAGLGILWRGGFLDSALGLAMLFAGLPISLGTGSLLIRTGRNLRALQGTKGYIVGDVQRFDERDHVFARNRPPAPDLEYYREFYSRHAEWQEVDAQRRKKGHLGQVGAVDKPRECPNVAASLSCLSMRVPLGRPENVAPAPHPRCAATPVKMTREEATQRTKGFLRHLGADLVGITKLDSLWVFTHRGDIHDADFAEWGREIELRHDYAIVFAVEMSADMVATAPHTASMLESCNLYARMALMANELASYIANLGYSATANHIGYYETMLVPLAVDAGLGEVGRFGFLVTEQFGPRVRLAAVTTNLPLLPDRPVDIGVEDFCRVCKKCALCCPSKSIPFDDLVEINGSLRWKLNAETCFDQWAKFGTDCNVCMRVCPWSHRRTWPHRLITRLAVRNRWASRIFSFTDDLFYGRIPRPTLPPKWAAYR